MNPWREHFVTVDGIRTHYLEAGSGRPVVLLHAGEFGGCAELSWEHTIPELSKHYRVIAPDWLGFGFTDKVHDFESGQRRRTLHMSKFLKRLKINSAAYVGNSMGGLVLARAIASTPASWTADAAVIISAGGFSPENEERQALLEYDCTKESMRKVLNALFYDKAIANDEEYLERRFQLSLIPGAWECSAAARFRSPAAERRSDFGIPDTTPWENISIPTLFVAGAKDPLKPEGWAKDLAVRVPLSQVKVYENCGHAPNIEMAESFNADLLAFLDDVYPSGK